MKHRKDEFKNFNSYKKTNCFGYTGTNVMKLMEAYEDLKVQCECSHKEIIPVWKHTKICSYCGRTIKNNTKQYFIYQMKNKLKEIQDKGENK